MSTQDDKTLLGQPEVGQVLSTAARPKRQSFPTVAGYDIVAELGRGGMGVVYKARQLALKRTVALKMIRSGLYAGDAEVARFQAEAEAAARLQHPNIVQIYAIGTHEDRPFFALEYVDGGTLARYLDGKPQPEREAAQLVETLARAIHFAHQRGVLHRDLKPANILLSVSGSGAAGLAGEESALRAPASMRPSPAVVQSTLAGDKESESREFSLPEPPTTSIKLTSLTPKVTDFGLAKLLTGDASAPAGESDVTPSGAVLGTPGYMAPEQASTGRTPIGPAADVYGLGAILYVALTGRPPFLAGSPVETILQVLHEEPVSPRRLRPALSRDIETICLRCLDKDPARRYGDAAALADDLRRYLNHEPILARPAGVLERTVKWARRRPALAALVVLACVGVVALAVMNYWLSLARQKESDARELAQRRELRAQREEAKARRNFELAAQAVEEFLTRISEHPHLRDFDLEDLRQELLETALLFHQKFVEQESDDPDVRLEQGKAFLRMGKILNETGDRQNALKNYASAEAIFAPLVEQHGNRPEYLRQWASSWNRLFSVLDPLGKRPEARRAIDKAIELRERLTRAASAIPQDRADLATSLNNLAVSVGQAGDRAQAEKLFERARALQETLVVEHPKQPSFAADLARTHYNLGFFLDPARGKAQFAAAAAIYARLIEDSTRPSALFPMLAKCYGNMAALADSRAEAETLYLEAVAILRKAADRHPSIASYRSDLARTYANLASVADDDDARDYCLRAVALQEKLVEQHPRIASLRFDLGNTLFTLAMLAEDRAARLRRLGDAVAAARQVLAMSGKHDAARLLLARACALRAEERFRDADYKRALADWNESQGMTPLSPEAAARRALALARLGLHAEASAEARRLAASVNDPALLLRLARVHALALAGAQADAKAQGGRDKLLSAYTQATLRCLEHAWLLRPAETAKEWRDALADADFAAWRARPEAQEWLKKLE